MLISLILSLALIALGQIGIGIEDAAVNLLRSVEFDKTLMQGMLSFLAGMLVVVPFIWKEIKVFFKL